MFYLGLLQLVLKKLGFIEQRMNSLADATGNILAMLGGAGVGDVELPEGVKLPLNSSNELAELNSLLDNKDIRKKLVSTVLTCCSIIASILTFCSFVYT